MVVVDTEAEVKRCSKVSACSSQAGGKPHGCLTVMPPADSGKTPTGAERRIDRVDDADDDLVVLSLCYDHRGCCDGCLWFVALSDANFAAVGPRHEA